MISGLIRLGRTPEEIKKWLNCLAFDCGYDMCGKCEYDELCKYPGTALLYAPEALALINRLESERDAALAKAQKWISLAAQKPDAFVSVQVYMTDAGDFPPVREGYRIDDSRWFYIPALDEMHPVSHWKPFDEPPKGDGHG